MTFGGIGGDGIHGAATPRAGQITEAQPLVFREIVVATAGIEPRHGIAVGVLIEPRAQNDVARQHFQQTRLLLQHIVPDHDLLAEALQHVVKILECIVEQIRHRGALAQLAKAHVVDFVKAKVEVFGGEQLRHLGEVLLEKCLGFLQVGAGDTVVVIKHPHDAATQLGQMLHFRMTQEPLGVTDRRHHGNQLQTQLFAVGHHFPNLLRRIAFRIGRIGIASGLDAILQIHQHRVHAGRCHGIHKAADRLHRFDLTRQIDLYCTHFKFHHHLLLLLCILSPCDDRKTR